MADVKEFQRLRSLGKLEQLSGACHHLGFYQNVGLSARYSISDASLSANLHNLIYLAVQSVVRQHSILSAIPVDEHSPDGYFARLPSIDLTRSVFFIIRSQPVVVGEQDRELDGILEEQHNTNFKSHYGELPFWRLLILQESGNNTSFTASFIFHHSIGDGAAGLIFHRHFGNALKAAALSSGSDGPPATLVIPSDTTIPLPLEKIHPLPIQSPPSNLPTAKLAEWTGGAIRAPCVTQYRSLYLSSSSTKKLVQKCRQNSLSLTSVLSATIAAALFDILPSSVEALTGIVPVNLRPWLDLPRHVADDTIGTFIDAFRVQLQRSHFEYHDTTALSILPASQRVSKDIKRHLFDSLSPSGEPYTAVAIFKTIPDVAMVFNSTLGKERDAAFEVSNLGQFPGSAEPSSEDNWQVGRMTFSRSSVVSGSAVTMSIVSGRDQALTIGFSWQEGVVESALVDSLITQVKRYLEQDDILDVV